MSETHSKSLSRSELFRVGLVVVIFAAAALTLFAGEDNYSIEARQRAAVASDILTGQARGRQALVGSLDYPPLPTVLICLLGLIPGIGATPLAGRLLSAFFLLFLSLYVYGSWRRAGVRVWMTLPCLIALLLMPDVSRSLIQGSSLLPLLGCVVPALGCASDWLRTRRLHDLAFSAILFALAAGIYYQALLPFVFCTVYILLKGLVSRKRYMMEASLIVFGLPTLYVVGLWFTGNWLIMGDPMFHVKHWLGRSAGYNVPTWLLLLSAFPWQPFALVFALAFLPALLPQPGPSRQLRRVYQCVILILVLCVAGIGRSLPPTRSHHYVNEEIRTLTRRLPARYRNEAFIVVGYDGYEFLKAVSPRQQKLWIHVMRLDTDTLQRVVADYGGRRILLILPASPTAEFVSDISLDLRPTKPQIPDTMLLLDRSDHWLIFECLPLPGYQRGA